MRLEGSFIEKIIERFEESFCLILLGIGFVLLFFNIDQSMNYDPTDMQNLLLLMIGSFGSYVFLMDLFFGEKRKPIMQKHLLLVVAVLLILGVLSVFNTINKGIQVENMPTELPLIDSAVFMFFFFFLLFFISLLMVDGITALVKKVKKSQSEIKNEITRMEEEE